MTIVVTGSIATDYLMVFPGQFADQLLPEHLDSLSLSFLVDDLAIRRGGSGANIAFNLGWLGVRPVLVGAVGADFADYGSWLERNNVDIRSVHTSQTRLTARFLCTTDAAQRQIASFYSGAMAEARMIELGPVLARTGPDALVLVAPNDPAAMLRHTEECRQAGYRFAADPSQQVARMSGTELQALVEGAQYLFTNEYERELLEHKTGWSPAQVEQRVQVSVTTLGAKGVVVRRRGGPETRVAPPPGTTLIDPTGVGDAFRAGFLAGMAWQLSDERAAQLGCTLATIVLETVGTQEHAGDTADILDRLAGAYGDNAAAEVALYLNLSTVAGAATGRAR